MLNRTLAWLLTLAMLLALGGLSALAEDVLAEDVFAEDEAIEQAEGDLFVSEDVYMDEGLEAEVAAPEEEASANASKGVKIDTTNFPDAAFREYVQGLYDSDGDGYLSANETDGITGLWVGLEPDNPIVKCKNVKGIQFFPNL